MYIQTLSHTSSHYTTQQSFDPSCTMEGLGKIQAVHPGCYTGLMWWWSLRVKLLSPRRGPYQNPSLAAYSLRALPNPHIYILRALPNSLNHTIQLIVLPSPMGLMKASATVLGPYQNPSASEYTFCHNTSNGGLTRTPPLPVFTKDDNIPSNDRALPNPHKPYQKWPTEKKRKKKKKTNKSNKQTKKKKKRGSVPYRSCLITTPTN